MQLQTTMSITSLLILILDSRSGSCAGEMRQTRWGLRKLRTPRFPMQAWSKGSLNDCLLRAVCGIASRFVFRGDKESFERAAAWISEAEAQLLARSGEPRMSDVEAWVLISLNHAFSRQFTRMLVSMSLAARLAYILRLNHEEERLPFLVRERRSRLMWSIYVLDTLYSSGRAEFTSCQRDTLLLRLPCGERSFSMDVPVMTESLTPTPGASHTGTSNLGTMAYCIRILDIRDQTNRYRTPSFLQCSQVLTCFQPPSGLPSRL